MANVFTAITTVIEASCSAMTKTALTAEAFAGATLWLGKSAERSAEHVYRKVDIKVSALELEMERKLLESPASPAPTLIKAA